MPRHSRPVTAAGSLKSRREWRALEAHFEALRDVHLRTLFAQDPERGPRLSREAIGVHFDYSKHRITPQTLLLLGELAEAAGLRGHIDAMFRGERINRTENRPALHIALRMPRESSLVVDGEDVVLRVHAVLERMRDFAEQVRSGAWRGHTGKRIRHVIHLGIGGSDLGPALVCEALRTFKDAPLDVRFVANVDATDLREATRDLDPQATLFIVASKSFTTIETMTNAESARAWCLGAAANGPAAVGRHFVAVSSDVAKAREFGIAPDNVFPLPDWVGGRYSVDSAIGLPVMLAIGADAFRSFLDGMQAMDEHFRTAAFSDNLPVLMGLLTVWYADFFRAETVAIIPYSHALRRFPAFIQQLVMDSNGKHVTLDGTPVEVPTSPIVWGEPGTDAQHSFFQLLHQGMHLVPCDFIGFANPLYDLGRHQALLVANMLAQAEALAFGKTAAEVAADGVAAPLVAHRTFDGNRPSSTIMLEALDPAALGKLIALYEHSVFTQSVIWNINAFDQWGVELGKVLAQRVVRKLEADANPELARDSSTNALIGRYRAWRRSRR